MHGRIMIHIISKIKIQLISYMANSRIILKLRQEKEKIADTLIISIQNRTARNILIQ